MGPLEILVLTFPGTRPGAELRGVVETVEARPDLKVRDAAVVSRSADRSVTSADVAIAADRGDRDRLLAAEDIAEVAELVPEPDTSALAIVVEHAWATDLAEQVKAAGGTLTAAVRIPETSLDDMLTAA
jgi:hypothetical protein